MKPQNKNPWKYAKALNLLPLYLFVAAVGVYAGSKTFLKSSPIAAAQNSVEIAENFSCNNFCGTFVKCLRDNGSLKAEHESMVPAIQDGCFSGCNKHQGMISTCYSGADTGCTEMVSCFQDRLRGVKGKPSMAKTRRVGG